MSYVRWRDEQGNLHGNGGSKNTWGFITQWSSTCSETETPAEQATYTVTHVSVGGARDSEQAVRDAAKTATGVDSGHHEFELADATSAEILAAADALSTHSITVNSRYIDAAGQVHNFQSGKSTYWLITKSEVRVIDPDNDRGNLVGNAPTLTGAIADQELTQGVAYTSAAAFPEATGATGAVTYSVANLPTGITLGADRKLTGTATAPLQKTSLTYTATDANDSSTATLSFNISVAPKATTLTATAGHKQAALSWTAIAGVTKWQYQQDTGSWRDIADSGAATTSHTVTYLKTSTAYSFKVRAVVGTEGSAVDGVASNAVSVTTPAGTDYDTDDDGLIEVANMAQLNAIRFDRNGNGNPEIERNAYFAAFPKARTDMGCPITADDDNVFDCLGFELTEDLDFDSDGDGDVDADDHDGLYWNEGGGWVAISSFEGILEGNGHVIKNLFMGHAFNRNALIRNLRHTAEVRNLGLEDVNITGANNVGGVVGWAEGTIEWVYVTGSVTGIITVGGLVGTLAKDALGQWRGSIRNSYSTADVTASYWNAGGLAGGSGGHIENCYATGKVTAELDIVTTAAGLVVKVYNGSTITNCYATGKVTVDDGSTNLGLVEDQNDGATITDSYWDTETTGQATSDGGVGKTTAELRAPTSSAGIYANWGADKWDYVHDRHYPLLKVDFDGDGTVTWQEFGPQPSTPGFLAADAIADQELTQNASYTSTAAFVAATGGNVTGTGGNGALTYSAASLPSGVTLRSDRKLTGTHTSPLARTEYTYKVVDADGDTTDHDASTLGFIISVAPKAVTDLAGAPGNGRAHLSWSAIAGVSGWEYLVNEKDATSNTTWAAITGSDAGTVKHTVTGLDNAKEYDFKVRAFVGDAGATPSTRATGLESNKATVDVADQTPRFTDTDAIADQSLTQGVEYTSAVAFPLATHEDKPFSYSVASLPTGVALNTTAGHVDYLKLTGTATAPLAKTSLTYTATDNDDSTEDVSTATLAFNISVAPKKPAGFTATAGDGEVTLSWTAIAGVTKWQYQQDTGSWTDISGSGAATNSHTVTGLSNSTSYSFKVRAVVGAGNNAVNGVASDAASATPIGASGAPRELVAVRGEELDRNIFKEDGGFGSGAGDLLSWFIPDDDKASVGEITGWQYRAKLQSAAGLDRGELDGLGFC